MITWKRIGLNNYKLPNIKEYNRKYLRNKNIKQDFSLTYPSSNDKFTIIDNFKGVGKDFLADIRENFNAGVDLHIPKNLKVKEPIRLDFYLDKESPTLVDYNNIYIEENSEVTIVMDYKSIDDSEVFHNGFTNIIIDQNSKLNIIKLQRFNSKSLNFDSNFSKIKNRAVVNFTSVEIGSKLTGFNYTSSLDGEMSESNLSSIYLGDKDMKLDLEYTMIHKGIRSKSNIQTRGALLDKAKKVFRGNLDFKRGARNSRGIELENVLLLSPTVKSDSIPALLCEEDNVEGEHAVTAGQIDKTKLFYLMSRGLSEVEAKKLIIESSFNPILNKIPFEDIKTEIGTDIERRLLNE